MMQLGNLETILKKIETQIGTRRKDEAFLNSKNWLPRVWRKFVVLKNDINNKPSSSSELTIPQQAKIIRTILKNIPEEIRQEFFEICQLNKNQITLLEKSFHENKDLSAMAFADVMDMNLPSEANSRQQKDSVKNIIPATPSDTNQDFNQLLGTARNVFLSNDPIKVQQLADALNLPDWYEAPIFDDPEVLYVALSACKEARITSQQYATLSQWTELKKHYGKENVKIFPLLDTNGHLTKNAEIYFLNHVVDKPFQLINHQHIFMTNEQIEQFRLAICQLPFSDRVLMRLPIDRAKSGYNSDIQTAFYGSFKLGIFDGKEGYTMLSTGAYQSFILTSFRDSAFSLEPRLGEVGISEIEKAVRQFKRIVSVYYPHPRGVKSDNPRFFHSVARKGVLWIGYHDMIHALMASYIPKNFHPILFQSVDTIRQALSVQWSTNIWHMVDYFHFLGEHQNNVNTMLIKLLDNLHDEKKFSPEIAALVLDVFFLSEKWKQQAIDMVSLHNSTREIFCTKNTNFSYFNFLTADYFKKEEPIFFALFKIAVIAEAQENSLMESSIKRLLKEIEIKKDDILPMLSLSIIKTEETRNIKKDICLCWNKKAFGETRNMLKSICEFLSLSELAEKPGPRPSIY